MNWKSILFWVLVFAGLAYFFFSFASYLFDRQEEMQLFIPHWETISESLLIPGGLCNILGLASTQYYCIPLFAALLNAALLSMAGICVYRLLQAISKREYNLIFALFPVMGLLKVHIDSAYVADGTFAILWMLLFLNGWIYLSKRPAQVIYIVVTTILLYLMAGLVVIVYSVLLFVFSYCCRKTDRAIPLLSILTGSILIYMDERYQLHIPLKTGFYSKAYHYTQIHPDSFIYHVWIRFSFLLAFLMIACRLMDNIKWEKRLVKITVTTLTGILFFFYAGYCLPGTYDVQNRMMDQLSYMSRRKQWEAIINIHAGKKLPGVINRNYLNMALAQRGELGDRLFYFDQHGPSGLLSSYNGTYYISILLSDIHFYIGDLSISESYAMEALTLARRGGSPRALQRLVQINLIQKEGAVVEKYLSLLEKMPCYKTWAGQYRSYLRHPDRLLKGKELAGKRITDPSDDTLLSLTTIGQLWMMHVADSTIINRIAMEYLGCSYLLAKETEAFGNFIIQIASEPGWQPLPVHFQEAAVMLDIEVDSILISPVVHQRYEGYCKALAEAKHTSKTSGLQPYGNTFWFYYQFREADAKYTGNANTQKSIYD